MKNTTPGRVDGSGGKMSHAELVLSHGDRSPDGASGALGSKMSQMTEKYSGVFSSQNLSLHHAKRGDPYCLEEQPEVQGTNVWEAHMCFQLARGWRTLPGGMRGAARSGCCQDLAGEVSHHCPQEQDTEKGHVGV